MNSLHKVHIITERNTGVVVAAYKDFNLALRAVKEMTDEHVNYIIECARAEVVPPKAHYDVVTTTLIL